MDQILAGPIVRRVERTQVNIWLASSKPLQLTGKLHGSAPGLPVLSDISHHRSVTLGERLFVHMVTVSPAPGSAGFPEGELLCYDLLVEDTSGHETSLVQHNPDVLFDEAGQELPGFFIPAGGAVKRIVHGSCRRPHAKQACKGWARLDQLSSGADLIAAHIDDFDERPAALFLTGDQIYADDVAMPVLAMLIGESEALTGWHERMPTDHQGGEVTPAEVKLGGRMHQLKLNQYGITSTAAENHLLTFAEYAGMYLAVLGGETSLPQLRGNVLSRIEGSYLNYKPDRKRAQAFFASRRDIRRLLANIPVYMIFDDHEVTDDWNLNPAWEANIYGNPFGRRLVANALAAYWAFQGWGNDPDKFDDAFISRIEAHLNSRQVAGSDADAFDAQMLDRQTVDRWAYVIPGKPFTVVLDTRMHRQIGSLGADGPCVLMNAQARDWLMQVLQQQRQHVGDDYPLLLISAAPVFGFARMEKFQQIASKLGLSAASLDLESWREGFAVLESVLADAAGGVSAVTILSGDVHYSFCSRGTFRQAGRSVQAAQLTSSPLSNQPAGGVIGKALLHVEDDDDYPDLLTPLESRGQVTSLNNIGLVCFADDGSAEAHILVARRRNTTAAQQALTFVY